MCRVVEGPETRAFSKTICFICSNLQGFRPQTFGIKRPKTFQDDLKEVLLQKLLKQFPEENSHFYRFLHFRMF